MQIAPSTLLKFLLMISLDLMKSTHYFVLGLVTYNIEKHRQLFLNRNMNNIL